MARAATQVEHLRRRHRRQFLCKLLQVCTLRVDRAGEVGAGGGAELGGNEFLLLHGALLAAMAAGGFW